MRSPVAKGSRVPQWPIFTLIATFIWFTASNEVHFAGLSTRITPPFLSSAAEAGFFIVAKVMANVLG